MVKRILSMALCLIMISSCLVSCGSKITAENPGSYITMYLTDEVYDFDPANAYDNESALKIVSLLFSPLFSIDEKGKVKNELVKSYEIYEDPKASEYKLTLELNKSSWSDGTQISANDLVYAWKRILEVESSSEAATLLYQIKNARKVKEGDLSIDALQVYAVNTTTVEIYLEEVIGANGKPAVDYDGFLRNLTSYALVPLREMIVSRTDDWAKKPATIVCSGPFKLRKVSYEEGSKGLILERNAYYKRDNETDKLDKAVTPFRLIVDYNLTADQIMAGWENGQIFYVGDIPLSYRSQYAKKAEVSDEMSTHTYYLNENAEINGKKLFAIDAVRKALSLAIDREAIASAVVFAKAANALVPYKVYNGDSNKKDFRTVGGGLISTTADIEAAKSLLTSAGIKASDYSFSIMVAAYDEVHVLIANAVAEAWKQLGFKVRVDAVNVIVNDDFSSTGMISTDIRDNIFAERIRANDYEVAAIDLVAYSPNAFDILAPFAMGFSGQAMDMSLKDENGKPYYVTPKHVTGFNSADYDAIIESVFAEPDVNKKASLLHDAEKLLMESMPVIPIIFNQDAYLASNKLSGLKSSYYQTRIFSGVNQKNWEKYVPVEETSTQ